jgi:large subunit ribosomal protein L29
MARQSWRDLPNAELTKRLASLREELRSLRFGLSGSPTRNAAKARQVRRGIARVLTEMRRRAIEAAEAVSMATAKHEE